MAPVKPAATLSPVKDKTCEAFAKKGKNVEVLITVLLSTKRPDAFGLDASQVDWDLVAQRLNLKNAKTASTRFGQVKKELIECAESMNLTNLKTSEASGGDDIKSEDGGITPPETPTKVKPDPEPKKKRSPRGKVAKGGAKNGGGRGRGRKAVAVKDEEEEVKPEAEQGSVSREESPAALE
ncbi:hypothetical protein TWF718_004246 [Orbilia javanica]|uniref:Uncharacterized protein n=1 Tax=Orbilia javanica TaxID=47235 RepID=A0AAN8N5W3_9PEZI